MSTAPSPPSVPSGPRRRSLAARLALAAVVTWTLVVLATCVAKYRNFLYNDFDFAIFSQATFGVLRGQWFSSIRGMHWLGDHSSLVLVALAPLAFLWRSPLLLPCVQALALAAGAWPLFRYARRRLGDDGAAAAFATMWVLHPALGYLATFEFHPETLATSALLGVAAALAARRWRVALACAAWAALAKEDAALPLIVLGAWTGLRSLDEERRAGWGLVAIGVASLVLSFAVLKPLFAHGEADYGAMYAAWGRSPGEILGSLARHPLAALQAAWSTPGSPGDSALKLGFWGGLMGPFAFLPFLAPATLLPALPVFAEHLLSFRPEQHTIVFQYTALSLPFVALAAVDATAWLSRRLDRAAPRRHVRRLALWTLLLAAASQALAGPWTIDVERAAAAPTQRAWPTAHDVAMAGWRRAFQRQLPAHGALVVDFPSLAPMSLRDSLHSLHHVAAGRYTFSSRPYPAPQAPAGLLADLSALAAAGEIDSAGLSRVRDYARTHGLRLVAAAGDLARLAPASRETLAWLAPAPDGPARVRFDGGLAYLGGMLPEAAVSQAGRLAVVTRWRRDGRLPGLAQVQWSVTDDSGRLREDTPRLLGGGWSDPAAWPTGRAFEERTTWVAPASLPPGNYRLAFSVSWRLGDIERDAAPDDAGLRAAGGSVEIGRFRVPPR